MTSLEELSNSIIYQLQVFEQRNVKLRRALQEENKALRAQLDDLIQADTQKTTEARISDLGEFADAFPATPWGADSHGRETNVVCLKVLPGTPRGLAAAAAAATSLHRLVDEHVAPRDERDANSVCVKTPPATPRGVALVHTPRLQLCKIDALTSSHHFADEPSSPRLEEDTAESSDATGKTPSRFFFGGGGGSGLVGVWAQWHKIISTMMNMSLWGVQRSKLESALLLRPAWETTKTERFYGSRSSASFWLTNTSSSWQGRGTGQTSRKSYVRASACSRWMLHPDSRIVNTWSLVGALIILYDVLIFPLAGFDLHESKFQLAVTWITAIFWTSDIVFNFLRGVHSNGFIEMRPAKICCLYAKSWLVVDSMLVSIDWVILFLTYGSEENLAGASKVLKSGKALRAARVIRAVRLIRTIKALTFLREMIDDVKSEYVQLLIKLSASVVGILVLSHYVTCSWFAQAYLNSHERTWITVYLGNDPRPSFAVEYATSMHFALTQLAGSQNIVPQNGMERVIASVIIVFDIVVFSALVGMITDTMGQFRSLTYERSREINLIRKFFARSGLPQPLENRIWRFFRKHYRGKNRFVNECDIEFFGYLPSSLKMDLHQHLYIPVLSDHPLLRLVREHDRFSMLAVCVTALKTATMVPEEELFAEGDIAKFMFFITHGVMTYEAEQFGIESKVEGGVWVSEATIWTKWMHCGRLTADSDSEVLKVSADMFEKTIYERAQTADWYRGLKKYAALFAQRVSDSLDTAQPITDVDVNSVQLESIVKRSFFYMRTAASNDSIDNLTEKHATTERQQLGLLAPLVKLKTALSSLSVMSRDNYPALKNQDVLVARIKPDRIRLGDCSERVHMHQL